MDYSTYEKPEEYWGKKSIMPKLILLWELLIGLPKSIVFNCWYFGLSGLKLPVLLSYKAKIKKMKGQVKIHGRLKTGMIKLGFTAPEMYDNSKLSFVWINDGLIEFMNKASMRNGTSIRNYGHLIFGDGFHISAPSRIICYRHIQFGDDILIGWDCEFTDGDAHKIYAIDDEQQIERLNPNKPIIIGNKVWFAAHSKILKGVNIGDNSVVAEGTLLTKSFVEGNVVIGGNPAKILKRNIVWKI